MLFQASKPEISCLLFWLANSYPFSRPNPNAHLLPKVIHTPGVRLQIHRFPTHLEENEAQPPLITEKGEDLKDTHEAKVSCFHFSFLIITLKSTWEAGPCTVLPVRIDSPHHHHRANKPQMRCRTGIGEEKRWWEHWGRERRKMELLITTQVKGERFSLPPHP